MSTQLHSSSLPLVEMLTPVYSALAQYAGLLCEYERVSNVNVDYEPIVQISELLHLSSFERDVLLLCAGIEIDPRFVETLAILSAQNLSSTKPTFALALACLSSPHWSAIDSNRPLRYWQLLDLAPGQTLLSSPLSIDSRILLYLLQVPSSDEILVPYIRRLAIRTNSQIQKTDAIKMGVHYWLRETSSDQTSKPLLLIAKNESVRIAMAQELVYACGFQLFTMRACDIPSQVIDRNRLSLRWAREALLTGAALYIQTSSDMRPDEVEMLQGFCENLRVPIAIGTLQDSTLTDFDGLHIHEATRSMEQRRLMWSSSLGSLVHGMNGMFERIVEQFDLPPDEIDLAGDLANLSDTKDSDGEKIWQICRERSRRSLNSLARRVEPKAQWDDLVLPDAQKEMLRQMVVHVRERALVYQQWGFEDRYVRGLAVTALFTGVSGTGKTMAAEILAGALDLDLFQIDLATIVSKYIGETEKNLRKIFDTAEECNGVLLFDEADSLFGKRTEVRDSHDRYANLEVSYLLQRMEAYRGVAILTTNMKHAIDQAFVRRIRFIVQFQFPDAVRRAAIWRRIFPTQAPVEALDYERLAQLNITGGIIRNIALQAAFFAAEEKSAIGMRHILEGTRNEYGKLDKSISPAETRGWI